MAREMALQELYQQEIHGEATGTEPFHFYQKHPLDPAAADFARELIQGVREHQTELDRVIQPTLANWGLNRLAVIDRLILRLASYEIKFRPDIPPVVAINEAVDLAKKFSTESSGAFVNGILDKIYNQITGKPQAGPAEGKETPAG